MGAEKWQFWIDRGGTFTDVVGRAPDGGLHVSKLLSEDPSYGDAAVEGMRRTLGIAPGAAIPEGAIGAVKMGTTVATNALLERTGARVLLLTNAGLEDLARIGTQARPRLFDLQVVLPELLHERVAGVPGRLAADGAEVEPLDEGAVRAALEAARADGIDAVAVAFLHAWLEPRHEARAAGIAREMGFGQVSASHEASRLIRLVPRGDTAVADAYLSPVLRRYVSRVRDALGGGAQRLMFMRSSGGLTDAAMFEGRDAILSGPAGGIVGMARTGAEAGAERIVGFDMGGTSTDVSHHAGAYERTTESAVAGVRLCAPMMDIHTVAAGGGSVLRFEAGRYLVGPGSAGADPGPAAYRRGGPLTVTDANVMLGRVSPAHFPAVFGAKGDEPLDVGAVRAGFGRLAAEIGAATGERPAPQAVADGFLAVAVDNMARAIRRIGTERGHDLTRYTLASFGGAGGQHACRVADALGMRAVMVHPLAGVLSAYGMGLAELRALRERQVDVPLGEVDPEPVLAEMEREAREELRAQGVEEVALTRTARLRYEGAEQTIEVGYASAERMAEAFAEAHRARFGFAPEGRAVRLDVLAVEAAGGGEAAGSPALPERPEAAPETELTVWSGGAATQWPLWRREALAAGQRIEGPGIVAEATGTVVIEPGWSARVDPRGVLLLERTEAPAAEAVGTEVDPVRLELMGNLFMSVAEQMGGALALTAQSVNIKERLDFSCALFDAEGNLVANAPHVPVHLGSMSGSVRAVIAAAGGDVREGDAWLLNSPWEGGTHLPDLTVVMPVFVGDDVAFWTAARGHHADVGGRTPGSAPPDSTRIEEEGVVIPPTRIMRGGALDEAGVRAMLAGAEFPARNPDQNLADIAAQVAACETGRRGLAAACGTHGAPAIVAYAGHVQDNAEDAVRALIGRLADGAAEVRLDHGAVIRAAVRVDADKRGAVVDFTGTSSQDPGNYNAPLAIARAVVTYVFRCLAGGDMPLNEGCLKPLRIVAPEGCLLNPAPGAAVIGGNTEVSQAATDALLTALGAMAQGQGTMNNFVWGNEDFQNYETVAGGTGAGPGWDGAGPVQCHMTNTRMTDPEVLERRFPVRLEELSVRRGSGGAGRRRGGDGMVRRLRFLEDAVVTTLTSRRVVAPAGGGGGGDGAVGEDWALRADGTRERQPPRAEVRLAAGDAFEMRTPGGGGWGRAEEG